MKERKNSDPTSGGNQGLSTIRNIFWPIERHEYKRVLPMAAMLFCILLNYSTLRSIKDGLIVTNIGAEALSYLKLYLVFPLAIIFAIAYMKLSSILKPEQVFYVVIGFFITYFIIFSFILYPNLHWVHPSAVTVNKWCQAHPHFQWPIKIFGQWTFATFYAMAEMWGSMVLSLLFWQFANQITQTQEAKRFYSIISMVGNFALIFTSVMLKSREAGGLTFASVMLIMIISGVVVMWLQRWMRQNVLADVVVAAHKKRKAKLSMGESLKLIFTSKYLGLIALLVLSYGISMNLIEGVWKSKIRQLYTTEVAYTAYMGQFQAWQGIASILVMIVGNNVLRKASWLTTAMITPVMIFLTGGAFFAFLVFDSFFIKYGGILCTAGPVAAAALIGMIQNVLSKATKYSLFDATKNMAYIPLDEERRTKGQAAVEVIGGRLGKSGGGFIQSTFFFFVGFAKATPYFAGIFFIILIIWLCAVRVLNKEYQGLLKSKNQ